jgi:septal ring factor EnvC (AmiA/AmiB activator)
MLRNALAIAIALACCLWLAAVPAQADDESELAGWKQRLEQAQADLTRSREQAAAAHAAYARMRRDRSVRGEEKAKVIAERAETEHAVSDAQARLDALREEARRAGVPAAWILPDPPASSPD